MPSWCRGWRIAGCLLGAWGAWAAASADAAGADVHTVLRAERWMPEAAAATPVTLPDDLRATQLKAPIEARYRAELDLGPAPPPDLGLYASGLIGHGRLTLNGVLLRDTTGPGRPPRPRGLALLWLVELPPHAVRPGVNVLELQVRSQGRLGVAPLQWGPLPALQRRYDAKAFGRVYGPAMVATLVASLGVSVLLVFLRRPDEPIYGFFGLGSLAWGLHTAWSVSPAPLLPEPHFNIWWTALYIAVAALLALFALRFAGRRWRGVERATLAVVAATPLAFYAAERANALAAATAAWRLGAVVAAIAALAVVAHDAWRRRSIDSLLMVLAGLTASAFGLRDWLVSEFGSDIVPVTATPYAGLPFVVLMAWLLIDRFVRAQRELESLNAELESRVRRKSAELAAALEQMRAARDAADAANLAKTRFLAAASHDLRQPLHALGLYAAVLRGGALDEAARSTTAQLESSVAALESMFDTLMDISRMDGGGVTPQLQPFRLEPLLRRLVQEHAAAAAAQALRLSVRIGSARGRAAQVFSDPLLVERVLRNLIGNAIKYTRSGGVLVSARYRSEHRAGPPAVWRVEVWDTGVGIAVHERERVFDEFFQAEATPRDRRQGLGLGLSIVRRLAQLLDLPLSLHSCAGRGTRFVLDLPASEASLRALPAPAAPGDLQGIVVAVLDDDAEVRDSTGRLLQQWGCRVLVGTSADEILHAARARQWSLQAVLADLQLGAGAADGIDAVARLRAQQGDGLPALLVSGGTDAASVRRLQAGGLPWLSKPVPAARLRSWLLGVAHPLRAAAAGGIRR